MHIYTQHTQPATHTQTHARMHTHVCTHTQTCARKYIHTQGHTHTPNAVRKRNTSPSLQNMSHTLQATSRGSVLVYSVNILQDETIITTVV